MSEMRLHPIPCMTNLETHHLRILKAVQSSWRQMIPPTKTTTMERARLETKRKVKSFFRIPDQFLGTHQFVPQISRQWYQKVKHQLRQGIKQQTLSTNEKQLCLAVAP